ncbi:MAG: hypothetical protein A3C06_00695 [Candidatus Taylorbacteria bacterium RIFCSPHIGHO2_02_FULL_46_13]|uniref:DUF2914 domain-containing protein n=2 Tax=Parcubacteria group TaxID=1794811 RepID=A0A1G2HTP0_9BACT|nr:MAG: hypothetical protein A2822_03605 [Candidatus Staskawiczbacteria bacterium RIFCSPHIGHO2_01_FULL_41_41]OGZ75031.1 MAG: hypothetical protein A3A12_04385 [Candidatus Staskawiczbacteria bacterium RIFCSPLOWO2_01_FULL_43_17b]OHA26058.1 MAG: hypothetical protein A3C06_00695 [Candidatus Taylorbacteria bacterium RIFCSPHIGHO2_02_FULL_46_13]
MKRLFNVVSHYQKIKALYFRYERWLMPATLVIGFLVDYFTFTSIQISVTFGLLLAYWALAGATILFVHFYDADKLPKKLRYARLFAPLVIQFTFGALLGSSLVFYWLSGALSVSWPLILIVAGLMVFNDIFRQYFLKPVAQVSVYFFATLSLFSLTLPFLFTSLSPWLFVLASALAAALFYPYVRVIPLASEHSRHQKRRMAIAIAVIVTAMNGLYFANIIPPIPLSLREAGLYHDLKVSGGRYTMLGEPETIWGALIPGQTLHVKAGETIYFYTAIFAPPKLDARIFHDWQYYDPATKEWLSQGELSFTIIGGRKEGYKGYSYRSNLVGGHWRIFVKNQRGQVLGRLNFDVTMILENIQFQEIIR